MDLYDSDSSLDDAESGGSTNVLLGYACDTVADDSFSQLGGQPTWLDSSQTPSPILAQCKVCKSNLVLLLQLNGDLPDRFPNHERRLYIWACRRKACRRKPGSIRAMRAVRSSEPQKPTITIPPIGNVSRNTPEVTSLQHIGNSLFGGNSTAVDNGSPFSSGISSNPFSISTPFNPFSSANPSNPFSSTKVAKPALGASSIQDPTIESSTAIDSLPVTFAAKASISNSATPHTPFPAPKSSYATLPWPEISQRPQPYTAYYLDADYEYLVRAPVTRSNTQQAAFVDSDSMTASSGSRTRDGHGHKEDVQIYESEHDQAFQHFADTVAQNPEQVLRYEFDGSPLLYSRSDAVGHIFAPSRHDLQAGHGKVTVTGPEPPPKIPKCGNCGAVRVFEVQLMPHAIAELEADDSEDVGKLLEEGMEWGTIIVAVCSQDCGSGDSRLEYLEEWVGVQWEEVISRGKGKAAS